jgi:hypothetical protein
MIDLLEILENLEKLYIDSGVKFLCLNQPLSVKFAKGRMLKKVEIGEAMILQFMPEIENLSCTIESGKSASELKKYLESHTQLKVLKVSLYKSVVFPLIATDNLKIKLSSLTLDGVIKEALLSNHAINFIKTQAKSLKRLKVESWAYNLEIIQDLFDGMSELETVTINGRTLESPSTEFVERNFECSKVKTIIFEIENFECPGFFRKFPNLERLEYACESEYISGPMVDSLAQNCRQLNYLWVRRFTSAFQNATFPELVELHFVEADDFGSDFETFLARHPKLKIFELGFHVLNEKIVWKLPTLLPNLIELNFQPYPEFNEADLIKLVLSWKSIKMLTIVLQDLGELDLEAVRKVIPGDVVVLQD